MKLMKSEKHEYKKRIYKNLYSSKKEINFHISSNTLSSKEIFQPKFKFINSFF